MPWKVASLAQGRNGRQERKIGGKGERTIELRCRAPRGTRRASNGRTADADGEMKSIMIRGWSAEMTALTIAGRPTTVGGRAAKRGQLKLLAPLSGEIDQKPRPQRPTCKGRAYWMEKKSESTSFSSSEYDFKRKLDYQTEGGEYNDTK